MAYHETVTPYFNLVRKTWPCPFYRRTAWLIQLSRGCNRWCRTQSPGCSYYSPIPWQNIECVTPKVTRKYHICHRFPRGELLSYFTGTLNIFSFSLPHTSLLRCHLHIRLSLASVVMEANWGSQVSCRKEPSLPARAAAPAALRSHLAEPPTRLGLSWPLLPFGLFSDAKEVGGED